MANRTITDFWYKPHWLSLLLLPLSMIFLLVTFIRRQLYRLGLLSSYRAPVPVIVVGNITVGGTGKTPLVVYLVTLLRAKGYKPGVVSRGYGGRASEYPLAVQPDSFAGTAGDEPVLIARRCRCPVVVDPNRRRAVRYLMATSACDVIISDDGMQHYALKRDIEIAVIDGQRRFGNYLPFPAGPLREPVPRLNQADLIVCNGEPKVLPPTWQVMGLSFGTVRRVSDDREIGTIEDYRGRQVHAVAGIGNPARFFNQLTAAGLDVLEHSFGDHHRFVREDICFDDDLPVLMTEKDAVKCRDWATDKHFYIAVDGVLPDEFGERVFSLLKEVRNGQKTA